MASKLFISAKEVAKELEVSDSYAYRLIRQLNAAPSEEEQEKARQEYLDKRGVSASYRW